MWSYISSCGDLRQFCLSSSLEFTKQSHICYLLWMLVILNEKYTHIFKKKNPLVVTQTKSDDFELKMH